ncbi:MAG: hypothetical protein FD123_188 [Bacteroidetes bacterium]|nr:MAG: hypothetical protein FD123_188 [Bacteroidota bacterium]
MLQRHVTWFAGQGQAKLSDRWSVSLDLQTRRDDWGAYRLQSLARAGASFHFADNLAVSAGGAFFVHRLNDSGPHLFRREWRSWEEIAWKKQVNKSEFALRFREEQRLMMATKDITPPLKNELIFRSRGRADYVLSLRKENGLFLNFAGEYMVRHDFRSLVFDQWRGYAGAGWKFRNRSDIALHYIMQYQRRGYKLYERHHILRILYRVQLDFRKKVSE